MNKATTLRQLKCSMRMCSKQFYFRDATTTNAKKDVVFLIRQKSIHHDDQFTGRYNYMSRKII